MKYWLFKEYIGGADALFSTRHEAEVFASKYRYYMEYSTKIEVEECEYDIIEIELNPNFDNWWSING
jgi:hypothetical protein